MLTRDEPVIQRRHAFDALAAHAEAPPALAGRPFLEWHRRRIHEAAVELLDRYMPPHAARAVDMGCGTGAAMQHWLAFPQVRVYGLDFSYSSLHVLHEHTAGLRPPAVIPLLVQGDAQTHLPFDDELFDVVYEYGLDFVLTAPKLAFREWLRILRPGGVLVASVGPRFSIGHWTYARKPPLGTLAPGRRVSWLDMALPGRDYYRFYSGSEIRAFIGAAPGRYRILEKKPLWYYYVEGRLSRLLNRAGRRYGAGVYDLIDGVLRRLYPIPSGSFVVVRKES